MARKLVQYSVMHGHISVSHKALKGWAACASGALSKGQSALHMLIQALEGAVFAPLSILLAICPDAEDRAG